MTKSTLSAVLEEMKAVPVNRLEEVYEFVHSLTPTAKQTENVRKKILSFGGAFSDMSNREYSAFVRQTKKARAKLFDRTNTL